MSAAPAPVTPPEPAAPPVVVVQEYGDPVRLVGVDAVAAERWRSVARRWKRRLGLSDDPWRIELAGDRAWLRAAGVTGVVAVDGQVLEIVPKFLSREAAAEQRWKTALWRILAAVEGRPARGDLVAAALGRRQDPADLMGHILLQSLKEGWLDGLPRAYRPREQWLPVARGRLVGRELPRMLWRPDQVPCRATEFVEDTPLNRLFRHAVRTLRSRVRSRWLAHELADLDLAFAHLGVSPLPPGIVEAERLRLPPQHRVLEPALTVARLLLRWRTLDHGDGERLALGFLWGSAAVFEAFVKHLVRRVCAGRGWAFDDGGRRMGTRELGPPGWVDSAIDTFPDVRILDGRSPHGQRHVAVLDAKYKVWRPGSGRPKREDSYQVLAAALLTGAPVVGLVYPKAEDWQVDAVAWRVPTAAGPDRRLGALWLDLCAMAEPGGEQALQGDLERQLDQLLAGP